MVFKCWLCKSYKFWNKSCYEVVLTSNDGTNDLLTKKVCQACGEAVDANYQSGKALSEIVVVGEEDE